MDPNAQTKTDTDTSHYFGIEPAIDIEKATNGEDADLPPGPHIPVGDPVNWTYEVENTGNVSLTGLTVTDDNGTPLTPGDDFNPPPVTSGGFNVGDLNQNNILDPGEIWQFADSDVAQFGQYGNIATATALDVTGAPFTDTDPSHYLGFKHEIENYDFGDAPEGAIAYPSTGVTGKFPTCTDPTLASHIQLLSTMIFFGPAFDLEPDGNAGLCSPYALPYNADECFQDGDAGLILPASPYTINAANKVVPCQGQGGVLSMIKDTAKWGINIDIHVTNASDGFAFVNLLIDWNQDGQWAFDPNTKVNGVPIPEHVTVNFPVPPGYSGPLSVLVPPDIYSGPDMGYIWARFAVTPVPVPDNWDGSGDFEDGEAEDYLLFINPMIPLSGWTIVFVFIAIFFMTVFYIKRR